MRTKLFTLIALATFCLSSQAFAVTVDFRDPYFSQYDGDLSAQFDVAGVGVTLEAFSVASLGIPGHINWIGAEGIGILGGDQWDEIDLCESLLITFSEEVLLTDISLYNLKEEGLLWPRSEIGYYSLNGGPLVMFEANSPSGYLYLPIPNTLVTSLAFYATPGNILNEYSVGGFSFEGNNADVPEPASLMLLGTGLVAFARLRRRKI